ncbi:uncharacterized protein LOC124831238 [Vigna umbellata]|uniref:uncharacterized protein LOC124831238 n=1 Tax=Vigna umbellata TaxID=87088 RepID=UPI001F5E8A14|nr:uncharacterized protein LOC124831238 [Vigna umbellata]
MPAAATTQQPPSGLSLLESEIPSPSSLFAETLSDSVTDVVLTYHENPGLLPGAPTALPSGGLTPCATCSKPCHAATGSHQHLVVFDGCERDFHLACDCVASRGKSKRWPLGVKQLLDNIS